MWKSRKRWTIIMHLGSNNLEDNYSISIHYIENTEDDNEMLNKKLHCINLSHIHLYWGLSNQSVSHLRIRGMVTKAPLHLTLSTPLPVTRRTPQGVSSTALQVAWGNTSMPLQLYLPTTAEHLKTSSTLFGHRVHLPEPDLFLFRWLYASSAICPSWAWPAFPLKRETHGRQYFLSPTPVQSFELEGGQRAVCLLEVCQCGLSQRVAP